MITLRDVSPRQLEALIAVTAEGTFARAATSLGFTQSAISQKIAALERAAGVTVFDRPKGPKPVELTRAGHLVLEHARQILGKVEAMDEELDRLRRGITGRLVIGTFQSVSSEILPGIVGRMRSDAPDVDLELAETDDLSLIVHRVLADETDLAFGVDIEPNPQIHTEVLGQDPFIVIAPSGDTTKVAATVADLNDHPLIGQPDNDACQLMIDRRLTEIGVRPDYAFRFHDNGAVQSMVRSGMGWSVMPSLAINRNDPGIVVLELDPPIAPRVVQLIRAKGRTLPPAADRFVAITREISSALLESAPPARGLTSGDDVPQFTH